MLHYYIILYVTITSKEKKVFFGYIFENRISSFFSYLLSQVDYKMQR